MHNKNFRWILYVILLVITGTIALQVYWNYKNYGVNKQQLVSDVQVSLDNAVNSYYESLAKKNTLNFTIDENNQKDLFAKKGQFSNMISDLNISEKGFTLIDSIPTELIKGITIINASTIDSVKTDNKSKFPSLHSKKSKDNVELHRIKDSVKGNAFELLTSKVVISITNDTLNLESVDSLFKEELLRKNLNIDYSLSYKEEDSINKSYPKTIKNSKMSATSKSLLLPETGILKVHYKNETKIILKRILSGILISVLLILVLVSCLFYMLKIINHQKQLAEVKNDLINNITHEFKTPITTISVALESIKDFNIINDIPKTEKYIDISTSQLSKLTVMVEKLLETASLDSENLELNKESVDITILIQLLIEKHQMQTKNKKLSFNMPSENTMAHVDVFHFENAINNILDNAVKYGDERISVSLNKKPKYFEVKISDNGNTLTKQQATQIFDKFYRVPKGNMHNVKGFGIGLYYTKKIIEKHRGTVSVELNAKTTFKITLPYV